MSHLSISDLETLCVDLPTIDRNKIMDHLKTLSVVDTARILGYDLTSYDNLLLAGRLLIFDLQKNVPETLEEYLEILQHRLNPKTLAFLRLNGERIQAELDANKKNDYNYDFFSAYTMIKTYLAKPYYEEEVCETPQYLFMRVAVQLYHDEGIERVLEVYKEMSEHLYTPASPTLFNSGFHKPSLASCFLSTIGDNLESILYTGVGDQGMISRAKGGIGMDLSRIRCSEINNVGNSKGLGPFVQIYDAMVRAVDQMAMRKGAACLFLRLHHINIFEFCELPLKVGDKYERAHNINISLWAPWIFFERIRAKGKWTLFCPAKTPQLNDIWGIEFAEKYAEAEKDALEKEEIYKTAVEKKKKLDLLVQEGSITRRDIEYKLVLKQYREAHRQRIQFRIVDALTLYEHIISIQRRAGMPFLCHADAINMKCNQKNLGYIRCSNLCQEITEYSSENEIASCNLHSLSLRAFARAKVNHNEPDINKQLRDSYDFQRLSTIVHSVIRNLNKVIDNNWYPLDKIDENGTLIPGKIHIPNKKHRPIGLGVSGIAESLHHIDLPFEDPRTVQFNKMLFGCIYFNALCSSVQLAIKDAPYSTFKGSPFSEGKLQFDLWREEFEVRNKHGMINPKIRVKEDDDPIDPRTWGQIPIELYKDNGKIDTILPTWDDLKRCVMKYGTRNSLLTALMPTATTSQVVRNCEMVEAHMANIYSRKVMNGGYAVVNRYMVWDLEELHLWNPKMLDFVQACGGSISKIHTYVKENIVLFPEFRNIEESWKRLDYVIQKYKTMWELPQKYLLKLTADRGRYIDQSQSNNFYKADPTDDDLKALHLHTFFLGLKNGLYYLRQMPTIEPIRFTLDPKLVKYANRLSNTEIKITIEEKIEEKKEKEEKTEEQKEICRRLKINGVECLSCQ